jgi:branched-chain amino acid transport system ATP-binding protein
MIAVENLSKRFGGVLAIDRCSLEIEPGKITGLIGPNGAGKTTLFNILTGFIKPSAGHIALNGQDVTGWSPNRLFHHGLVRSFQIPHEFGRLTLLESLMLVPASQLGENIFGAWFLPGSVGRQETLIRKKALQVLETLRLGHLRDEPAGRLSGGQKKLLEFGRILMADPRIVLLDEPGAGVNNALMQNLAKLIVELNRDRGYTFLIIEHNLDLIANICDSVIVMAEGRPLARGTMAEVRQIEAVKKAYLGESLELGER